MFGRLFQPEAIFDSKCIKAFGDRAPPDSPAGLKGSLREGRDKTGNESSSYQQFWVRHWIQLTRLHWCCFATERGAKYCDQHVCLSARIFQKPLVCTGFLYMLSVFSNFTGRICNLLSRLHSVSQITSGLPIIGKAQAFSFWLTRGQHRTGGKL